MHYLPMYSFVLLGSQRPKPKELHGILTNHCKYWRGTGLHLGLEDSVLRQIASAHPTSERECFRVTLEKWDDLNVGVTWGNLEVAITNANREHLGIEALPNCKKIMCCTYAY